MCSVNLSFCCNVCLLPGPMDWFLNIPSGRAARRIQKNFSQGTVWNVKVGPETLDLTLEVKSQERIVTIHNLICPSSWGLEVLRARLSVLSGGHTFPFVWVFSIMTEPPTGWTALPRKTLSTHRLLTASVCEFPQPQPFPQFSRHLLGVPQFSSDADCPEWEQIPQVKGSVPQDCSPPPQLYIPIPSPRLSPVLLTNWHVLEVSTTPSCTNSSQDSGKHFTYVSWFILKILQVNSLRKRCTGKSLEGPEYRSSCPCRVGCVTFLTRRCVHQPEISHTPLFKDFYGDFIT